jgi:hypothetical protein
MLPIPALTPYNTPGESTIKTVVAIVDHVPPLGEIVSVSYPPTHMLVGPANAEGSGFTVTIMVDQQPVERK